MKNRRVLLIEPPFDRLYKDTYSLNKFPFSLAYLAGAIKKETEWEVMAYNADFSPINEPYEYRHVLGPGFENFINNIHNLDAPIWQEVHATIKSFSPAIVGITSMSPKYASASVVAKIAKAIDHNIVVVVGGPHPSMVKTDILKNESFDLGVVGEGEQTIVDILKALEGLQSFQSIPGIVYRQGNDFIENPPRPLLEDLDALPFPISIAPEVLKDYGLYPKDAFKCVFTIRGCPYNCSFCGSRNIWTRKVRFRSVTNILAEMKELHQAGLRWIHFDDDTFGVKKSHIKELCLGIMRECPGLSWSCEIHVNLVDAEIIGIMKRAGCRYIQLGVESGNNDILKAINKNTTIEKSRNAARIIKKNHIALEAFFIVGFPQETEESLHDTIKAIRTFPCDAVIYNRFTPYPATKLFQYCQENGIIPSDFDVSLFNNNSPLNYFSVKIPKELFFKTLRQLEKDLDKINARKKLRRYFSYEGYLKLREKGLGFGLSRLKNFFKNLMHYPPALLSL